MAARAVIFGCGGTAVSAAERAFFADADPWGFILFARNVESPEQLARLTGELRESVGRDAPVLVDQEGGRVQRMRAPHWRDWLPMLDEAAALAPEARARGLWLRSRLIAAELRAVGIDVNCAPVLDLACDETHAVIRNRCLGGDPAEVARLGRAVAEGFLAGGVLPVIKHMPGQGRAALDSHLALPEVTADRGQLEADFAPFRALADLPIAMTAHVVYRALDTRPATQSPSVIGLVRDEIGFDGLLLTDDLSMKALAGDFGDRARASLAAGCDIVLHCNGDAAEMAAVAAAVPELSGRGADRAAAALALRRVPGDDASEAAAEYAALTAGAVGVA
jgi:beta-N-acetylhexosaminidase